ncbi:hypothetical protein DFH09DRAFT_1100155 [Mycena vulgaris]|nr:hypothetical protein DFH09DRAFT_1100155 [Mycena vulgaris]
MLRSPDAEVRKWLCKILGELVNHEITVAAVFSVNPCEQLLSLLRDKRSKVVEAAKHTRTWIAKAPGGAQAAFDVKLLDCVADLIESSWKTGLRKWTCEIVGQLSHGETTTISALAKIQRAWLLFSTTVILAHGPDAAPKSRGSIEHMLRPVQANNVKMWCPSEFSGIVSRAGSMSGKCVFERKEDHEIQYRHSQ